MKEKFCYSFIPSKYDGYRRLCEKNKFKSFKKLRDKCEGLNIQGVDSQCIVYEIDSKLIRKIKLLKIKNEIKTNSIFDKISQLFNGSEKYDYNKDSVGSSIWASGYYWSNSGSLFPCEKLEIKNDYSNKARLHTQKLKNYENKARFRK